MTREYVSPESAIGKLTTTMSMLATVVDWLLHRLQIDAILLLPKLLTFPWVVLQLDQQEPVRQKLLRILVELLVCRLSSSTALIK
jgi:hypothetical protein